MAASSTTSSGSTTCPGSEPLAAGLAQAMHSWARGVPLERVLVDADMAAGDFVRWAKQTIDLLDQLSIVADGAARPHGRDGAGRGAPRDRRVLSSV